MRIQCEQDNDINIIKPGGEIQVDNAGQFEEVLMNILEAGSNKIILDFESISFIDSSGLRVIMKIMGKLQQSHGKLALCCVNRKIKGILEITKLLKLLTLHDSKDQALKDFRNN